MILKDPWSAGGVRGSIGAVTFSIWRGNITGRTRTRSARRGRTTQPRNRSILGYLSRAWGGLTDAQRVLWENYALNNPETNAFGMQFIMSGINAFVKLNHTIIRMWGYGAQSDTPPVAECPASIDVFTAITGVTNPGDCDLDWTHLGVPVAGDKNEVRIAGPFASPGRQQVFERKKFQTAPAGTTVAVTIAGLIELMWYWFFVRYVDDAGQTTAWASAKATPMVTP